MAIKKKTVKKTPPKKPSAKDSLAKLADLRTQIIKRVDEYNKFAEQVQAETRVGMVDADKYYSGSTDTVHPEDISLGDSGWYSSQNC